MLRWLKKYFRQRRVFTTYDATRLAGIRAALRTGGVEFKIKERSEDISMPANGLANLSQVIQAATEYSVYVDQDDLELAEYLVGGGRLD